MKEKLTSWSDMKDKIIEILDDYTVPVFNAISKTHYKNVANDILKETNRANIIREFIQEVEHRAEEKMLMTGKLEGAHYAAMKELSADL